MNNTKGVICLTNNTVGLEINKEYFSDLYIDDNGYIKINCTDDIWKAKKFIFDTKSDHENKKISALIRLIKIYFGDKYNINFLPIKLEY